MPRLLGERVMLREYRAEDIGDIRKWVNDAQTTRYLSTRFWPAPEPGPTARNSSPGCSGQGTTPTILSSPPARMTLSRPARHVPGGLAAALRGAGHGHRGEADRGQGFGTEALGLMQAFAFQTLGLERLELEVHTQNLAARRCYEKAGFTLEGVRRHAFYSDGRFCDVAMLSVLRDEYLGRA